MSEVEPLKAEHSEASFETQLDLVLEAIDLLAAARRQLRDEQA